MPFLLGPHGSMMLGEKEEDAEKFSSTSKPVLLMQADQCGLLHAPVRNPPDLPWIDAVFPMKADHLPRQARNEHENRSKNWSFAGCPGARGAGGARER